MIDMSCGIDQFLNLTNPLCYSITSLKKVWSRKIQSVEKVPKLDHSMKHSPQRLVAQVLYQDKKYRFVVVAEKHPDYLLELMDRRYWPVVMINRHAYGKSESEYLQKFVTTWWYSLRLLPQTEAYKLKIAALQTTQPWKNVDVWAVKKLWEIHTGQIIWQLSNCIWTDGPNKTLYAQGL